MKSFTGWWIFINEVTVFCGIFTSMAVCGLKRNRLSISQLKVPFYHRSPHKEYPMDSEAPTNLQHKIPLTEQPTPVNSLVFAGRGAKLKTFISDINIQNQANQLLELRPFRGCACETRSVFCQIASWDSASSLCHLKVVRETMSKFVPPKQSHNEIRYNVHPVSITNSK